MPDTAHVSGQLTVFAQQILFVWRECCEIMIRLHMEDVALGHEMVHIRGLALDSHCPSSGYKGLILNHRTHAQALTHDHTPLHKHTCSRSD